MPLTPVTITYNGLTLGSATYPTPYLSRDQSMVYTIDKWCQVTKLSLAGKVTGTYDEIYTRRAAILAAFSTDFKSLVVAEDGSDILQFDNCIIRTVNFSPSNFGAAEYSIEIECYESSNFNGTFGILDPVNEWSLSQQDNNFVSISHKVSARGFKTANQPVVNARNFVKSFAGSGTFSQINPAFASGISEPNLILVNSGINIDRVAGTCSLDESYVVQTGVTSEYFDYVPVIGGVTSAFNADVNSGISEDFINVGVNYTIQGSKTDSTANLRSKIPTVQTLWEIATGALQQSGSLADVDLNTGALNYSIDEDLNSRTIYIKTSFNNDYAYKNFSSQASFSGAYYDYSVKAETDQITSITTIGVNGSIKAQTDGIQNRIDRVSGMYYNYICNQTQGVTGYLHALAALAYADLGFSTYSLNPGPESISVGNNYVKGEINLNATFSDKDFKSDFKSASFTVGVKPSLAQYRAKASANRDGLYQIFDLETRTREEVTVGGNLIAYAENTNYQTEVRDFVDSLRKFYVPSNSGPYVTSESVDETPAPHFTIGFNHGYNYATPVNGEFIPYKSYSKIMMK